MDPTQKPNQLPEQPIVQPEAPQVTTPLQPTQNVSNQPVQSTQPFVPPAADQSINPPTPLAVQPPVTPQPIAPAPNPFDQPAVPTNVTPSPFDTPQIPQQTMSTIPGASGWKRFVKPIVIAVIIIAVLVGGYFAYLFISAKVQKVVTTNTTDQVAQSTKSSTPEINTLKTFTMLAPETSKTQGMVAEQAGGAMRLTSADGSCTLIYGTETQTQLPGTDIGDVISQYLAKIKQQSPHLQVNGPNKAAALVLAGTDGKSYSLPTVNFTYTDTTQAGAANGVYSVSQLSGGSHAVVASICGSDTAKAPAELQPRIDALEAAAATIKVNVQ